MPAKDMTSVALFAALVAGLGMMPPVFIPVIPVPVTAQTLGVMLAGAVLGARRGLYAILVFLVLVAVGLPLLSGGKGGFQIFFGPATGYLLGWILSVWLVGFFYERFRNNLTVWKEIFFLITGGVIAIHAPGIVWLSWITHMSVYQAFLANLVFIPGDIIKITITLFLVRIIRKALPDMFS